MRIPSDISDMIDHGALVAINHSGGKDSQAMTIRLVEAGIPRDQLLIVHATLGDVEWPGTIGHIRTTTFGLPLVIARPRRSFFGMVRARGMFPSTFFRAYHFQTLIASIGPKRPMPCGLPRSAARVAGEISAPGRSRIRPCGLTAA